MSTGNTPAIELRSVSKIYRSYPTPRHRLMELLSGGRKRYYRETRALDDVSIQVQKGDRLGIVGENGSGKSTLLKLLAGVLAPTVGTVDVHGRISALLELGAGFNPELTGRDNIGQFCMLHGMHHDEVTDAVPRIIQFSELGEAIEHPTKTYSTGMAVRLGFSCAVYVQPEILIVDEALSVGDAYFQNKCLHKIRSLLDDGVTFVYVSHAADAVRSLCNRAVWLEHGRVRQVGAGSEVSAAYQSLIFSRLVTAGFASQADGVATDLVENEHHGKCAQQSRYELRDYSRARAFADRVEPLRTGGGEARITDLALYDEEGNPTDSIGFRQPHLLRAFFRLFSMVPPNTSLNIGLTDNGGKQICHFSSLVHGVDLATLEVGKPYAIEFRYPCSLCPGEYGVQAGISSMYGHPGRHGQMLVDRVMDYCVGGARFNIRYPETQTRDDLWGVVAFNYSLELLALD